MVNRVPINRIIRFSCVDGPGNRTAIFLQGCNLNCLYCHNPETRSICCNCGACVEVCPAKALTWEEHLGKKRVVFTSEMCQHCDSCLRVCPHDSSPKCELLTAEEVWKRVEAQMPFIRGITVSGGECMRWPDFLLELFTIAKSKGMSTLIDSNGTIPFANYPSLLEVTSGVMLDVKAMDNADHIRITGSGNREVLENLRYLHSQRKLTEIRIVVVPDLYDPISNARKLLDYICDLYGKIPFNIKFIAYRRQGVRKIYDNMAEPSERLMKLLNNLLLKYIEM